MKSFLAFILFPFFMLHADGVPQKNSLSLDKTTPPLYVTLGKIYEKNKLNPEAFRNELLTLTLKVLKKNHFKEAIEVIEYMGTEEPADDAHDLHRLFFSFMMEGKVPSKGGDEFSEIVDDLLMWQLALTEASMDNTLLSDKSP